MAQRSGRHGAPRQGRRQGSTSRRPSVVPRVEPLEARSLMSVGLDPSFGVAGQVAATFGDAGGTTQADAVAIQADGKILVAGTRSDPGSETVVERFDADGAVDTTFGQGGTAVAYQGASTPAKKLLIQPDGKIVLASTSSTKLLAFRLNADGSADTTFGTAGTYQDANRTVAGLALQADGKIVLVGTDAATGGFLAERLDPDGTLDTGFGTAGVTDIAAPDPDAPFPGPRSHATSVAIQADGKIVIAGGQSSPSINPKISGLSGEVIRLDADGTLDTSFATKGFASGAGEVSNDVVIGPDGEINTIGASYYQNGLNETVYGYQVLRLTTAGVKDPSYSGVIFNGPPEDLFAGPPALFANYPGEVIDTLAIEPDGQVVTAGGAQPSVARLTNAGNPDPVFAPYGFTPLARGSSAGSVATATPSIAIQPNGQIIVVSGAEGAVSGGGFTINRLNYAETPGDFFETGQTDPAIEIPSQALVAIRPTSGGSDQLSVFGIAGAGKTIPAPGDYDGSGRSEIGVYLPSLGSFAYRPANGGADVITPFGIPGAGKSIPVPGNYDGSNQTELAVYLPSLGDFAYRPASGGPDVIVPFGFAGQGKTIPAPADYFGTGRDDIAAYLPSLGAFAIRNPAGGPDEIIPFGIPGDGQSIPVPGDYDGSGKAVLAVYIPSQGILVYRPADYNMPDVTVAFGAAGAGQTLPMPGDYDGTGRTNVAAYLPAFGLFAYRPTSSYPTYGNPATGPDVVEAFGVAGTGKTIPFTANPPSSSGSTASAASVPVAAEVVVPIDPDSPTLEPVTKRKAKA